MREEEFMEIVKRQVAEQPATLGKLFKFISTNWDEMVETQRLERHSAHIHALGEMLDNLWASHINARSQPRLFNNIECCTLLEAMWATDPACTGGSPARRELLAHIANSMRVFGWKPDDDFIKGIRKKSELLKNLYTNFPEHRIRVRKVSA